MESSEGARGFSLVQVNGTKKAPPRPQAERGHTDYPLNATPSDFHPALTRLSRSAVLVVNMCSPELGL